MLSPIPGFSQVTYFNKPPTPEELQRALKGSLHPDAAESSPAAFGRGIRPIDIQQQAQRNIDGDKREQSKTSRENNGISSTSLAVAVPVSFKAGSSKIHLSSLSYIDAIATVLNRDPSLKLIIEGHTDASGDARHNMMLSWERAFTVFKLLVGRYGIDPARLYPLGKGATEPIDQDEPTASINRRVQFRVMG
ncbi:MAG TPA: OmpA family protein [Noviherbaspirillum sp.]|nr:OmpA family protein [Noviherbaspirillum sp.]